MGSCNGHFPDPDWIFSERGRRQIRRPTVRSPESMRRSSLWWSGSLAADTTVGVLVPVDAPPMLEGARDPNGDPQKPQRSIH